MTGTPNDDPEKYGDEWDPVTETREWSSAGSELACYALARSKGRRLIQIINTKREPFPIICIFEDYPE